MQFSDLLKKLRDKRELTVARLSDTTGIAAATLYAYESGRRGVPRDKKEALLEQLCIDKAEREEFEALWAEELQSRAHAPFQEKFGSETTALSLGDLTYQPFSGGSKGFMNKLLKEILDPARIRIEVREDNPEEFDIEGRIRLIEESDANLLINLQTPMRMRKLRFLPTPIRISLNGVILQQEDEEIRAARSLLVTAKKEFERTKSAKPKFIPVAILNEVGHTFLLETLGVAKTDIEVVNTLNPVALAKCLSPHMTKMLVCDEITALAVVGAAVSPATLVMPPSTDESELNFEDRRRLPVHYLGFAVGRHNDELANYLAETIENFLSTEIEIAAELLQKLYDELVAMATLRFNQNIFLYSGGLRRVPNPLQKGNKSHKPAESALIQQIVEALLQQNARAFAKRCLSISRRSIAELPDHLSTWRHALQRARERVLIIEARNRTAVREVVVSAMKAVLGMDPVDSLGESYHTYFQTATDDEHWPDFKELLERELDVSFSPAHFHRPDQRHSALDLPTGSPKTHPFASFEFFVSALQRTMEENKELTRIISVKCIASSRIIFRDHPESSSTKPPDMSWEKGFSSLWNEYCAFRHVPVSTQPERALRLTAFSLGQAVGFLTAVAKPFKDRRDDKKQPGFQVMDLFVTEVMRQNGISRRMIRALIDTVQIIVPDDASTDWECVYVWSEAGVAGLEGRDEALARSGFTKTQKGKQYFYRLYGLRKSELSSIGPAKTRRARRAEPTISDAIRVSNHQSS